MLPFLDHVSPTVRMFVPGTIGLDLCRASPSGDFRDFYPSVQNFSFSVSQVQLINVKSFHSYLFPK